MERHRIFSLDEANEAVAHLTVAFERLHRLRDAISEAYRELKAAGIEVEDDEDVRALDPSALPEAIRPAAARFKQMVREVERTLTGITTMGCIIKDLRMGLVDFYSVVDGEPVFLCWQYGEESVGFYHGLGDGYAGRQPLPSERRSHVLYN